MIVRSFQRLIPAFAAVCIIAITLLKIYDVNPLDSIDSAKSWHNGNLPIKEGKTTGPKGIHRAGPSTPDAKADVSATHREIFSLSGKTGFYFPIIFGEQAAINPNIIPHPQLNDSWIIVGQDLKDHRFSPEVSNWFSELVCTAHFQDGALRCMHEPIILPIGHTVQHDDNECMKDEQLGLLSLSVGPHDARVFMGPDNPWAVWGSNSRFVCMGMHMQDFRMLFDWGFETSDTKNFRYATELQRPAPRRPLEKNYFPFWDLDGTMYVHYDIAPKRAFAKLEKDGSVGANLAELSERVDEVCIQNLFPDASAQGQALHQATNSLSVTLCDRGTCTPDSSNTFVMTVFQHKAHNGFHAVYSPYVALFSQKAPFELFAVSSKPFWIHGTAAEGRGRIPQYQPEELKANWNQTEMIYITSMSWKQAGQKYHGFRDDILFLGFGIEDEDTAGIDFKVGDLFQDLSPCVKVTAGAGAADDVPGLAIGA